MSLEKLSNQEGYLPKTERISLAFKDFTQGKIFGIINSSKPEDIYKRLRFFDNPPLPDREQLLKMFNDGDIPPEILKVRRWQIFADYFNSNNKLLIYYGFKMPRSLSCVITRLGGDINISTSAEYVLSLFKNESFIIKKTS